MHVLFLVPHPQEGASGRCRVFQYLPWLDRAGITYEVRPFMSPALFGLLYRRGRHLRKMAMAAAALARRLQDLRRAGEADVIVIHREALPLGTDALEARLARSGRPLVFDFDDAIWLGHVGEANAWTRWLRRPQKTARIMRRCAAVIAGNDVLAEYARRHNGRVTVIPTPVDTERFVPHESVDPRRPLVIGWMGSPTTAGYLAALQPVFAQLARDTPGLHVRIVGATHVPLRVPGLETAPWRLGTELDDLQAFDIGIMPMPDDEWARGKCGYKALLYMAVGIPVVASPVGVNCRIVRDGVNGFLAPTPEAWLASLRRLAADAELRRRMGQAGRALVTETYSVAANAPAFLDVLRAAASGSAAPSRPAPRVHALQPAAVAP